MRALDGPILSYFVGYTSPEAQVPPHLDREQCALTLIVSVESAESFPISVDQRVHSGASPTLVFQNGSWWGPLPPDRHITDYHLSPGDVLALRGTRHIHYRRRGLRRGDASLNVLLHYVEQNFRGALY